LAPFGLQHSIAKNPKNLANWFCKSSNIGMAHLIDETFGKNSQKFVNYMHQLSLSKPLGFTDGWWGAPLIKDPRSPGWSGVTLPWMSIGYELRISSLHTLTLYYAVANSGKMIQPMIVKRIKQANRTIKEFKAAVLNKRICNNATLQKLKTMLEGVVECSSVSRFGHGFYQIAGKSGTANKVVNQQSNWNAQYWWDGYSSQETILMWEL